ncbi:MAG: DUF1800 domain-containing protein [Planctomycetes bacterium]|nr:DUF1800 domain-containing protein [Planctomycetota bacterium]
MAAFRVLAVLAALLLLMTRNLEALEIAESRHLLARTGFGATPAEVADLQALTREQAVDALLARTKAFSRWGTPKWCEVSLAENAKARQKEYDSWKDLPQAERDKKSQERERIDRVRGAELKAWWYHEMLTTDTPLTERMVLFWHNHFTSQLETVRDPLLMHEQNRLFRAHALGNYADLLKAMPLDPAMFIYLDSNSNVADRPNENFAREVMELFTVGEGFYTEKDIKEAARSFSGYQFDPATGRPVRMEQYHDGGRKLVLGHKGVFDADEVMRILLEREERVAIHLTEKLWQEFVDERIDDQEVYRLAAVFYKAKYEMKPLMRALLTSDAFWDPARRGILVKSPVELLCGTMRSLGLPAEPVDRLPAWGRRLGQDVLDPPNVKGWKGGAAWISTYGLLARTEVLDELLADPAKAAAPWIVDARKSGGEGIDAVLRLVMAVAPARPIDRAKGFDAALRQVIRDPAYNLK